VFPGFCFPPGRRDFMYWHGSVIWHEHEGVDLLFPYIPQQDPNAGNSRVAASSAKVSRQFPALPTEEKTLLCILGPHSPRDSAKTLSITRISNSYSGEDDKRKTVVLSRAAK